MTADAASTKPFTARCRALVSNPWFDSAILLVIVLNATVLGLQTFNGIATTHQAAFDLIYRIIFGIYVAELLIRFAAVGWNIRTFIEDKWNVFDFVVIALVFVPAVRGFTVLRLVRLARVVRVVRFLPDLHVITVAIARSVRGMTSLAAATALLVYIFGMLGWIFFANSDPDHYGNVARAMLTLFVMLTLENLPDNVAMGMQVSRWSILFFISYAVLMSFLIFNLFISIVLNSMEEARAVANAERERTICWPDCVPLAQR